MKVITKKFNEILINLFSRIESEGFIVNTIIRFKISA